MLTKHLTFGLLLCLWQKGWSCPSDLFSLEPKSRVNTGSVCTCPMWRLAFHDMLQLKKNAISQSRCPWPSFGHTSQKMTCQVISLRRSPPPHLPQSCLHLSAVRSSQSVSLSLSPMGWFSQNGSLASGMQSPSTPAPHQDPARSYPSSEHPALCTPPVDAVQ